MHFCRLFLFGRRVNVLLGFLNRGDGIVDGIDGVGHTGAVVRRLGAFRLVVVGDLSFVPISFKVAMISSKESFASSSCFICFCSWLIVFYVFGSTAGIIKLDYFIYQCLIVLIIIF